MVEVEHGDWIPYHFFIGLAIAFISFLCCSVVMWLGNLSRIFPTYRKLEKEAQREWRARIVAFWHSIFAVFFITHALWHFPYQDDKGVLYGDTWELRVVEAISCGYFLWDSVVMILYWGCNDYFGVEGFLHGAVCFCVYTATMRPFGMYITGLHLLFEWSTPFLHIRWFLIKFGRGTTWYAIANEYLFVLVFFLCRVAMGPFYMYRYLSLTWVYWNTIFHAVMFPSIVISNGLNYYWFYLIMRSALVASPEKKKARNNKKRAQSAKKKN